MPFDKDFFEKINDERDRYLQNFPCGAVTVRISVHHSEGYNVERILNCSEHLLTFTYFNKDKSAQLPEVFHQKTGETIAWPALTVPYDTIISVELNPGKAEGGSQAGFKNQSQLV